MKQINIFVQNEKLPSFDLNLDYSASPKQYLRAFANLHGNDSLLQDKSVNISRERFPTDYCLYTFYFQKNLGDESYFDQSQISQARLSIQFANNTNPALRIIVFFYHQVTMQINAQRNVLIDYNL